MVTKHYLAILDFVRYVRSMRAAQRMYFATRTQEALIASKGLEAKVDDLAERLRELLSGDVPLDPY